MSKKLKIFLSVFVLIIICVPIYLQFSKSELTNETIEDQMMRNYSLDMHYNVNFLNDGVLKIVLVNDEDKKGRTLQSTCQLLDNFRKYYILDNITAVSVEKFKIDKTCEWTIYVDTDTIKNNKWMKFTDSKKLIQKLNMKYINY